MVYYLIKRNISPPDIPLEIPRVGEENRIFLQQLMLVFGLKYNDLLQPNTSAGKPKLGQAYDDINEHSKALEDNCKFIKFAKGSISRHSDSSKI